MQISRNLHVIPVRVLGTVVAVTLAAGCIDNQRAPDLAGPSGFGQAVTLTASPDTLPRNGAASSLVVVNFHDTATDTPLGGQTLVLEATAGTLSTGQVVTDEGGNASVTFVAPDFNSGATEARVFARTVGTNASNERANSVVIRLFGPAPPVADFIITPETVTSGSQAVFDASASTFGSGTAAASYDWDFDGTVKNGRIVTQTFAMPGTYPVSLTVTDTLGRTAAKVIALEVQ